VISLGRFSTELRGAWTVFRDLGLAVARNQEPKYPDELPALVRSLSYKDAWRFMLSKGYFDVRLENGAFLTFRRGTRQDGSPVLGYCYYDSPVAVVSYERFVFEVLRANPREVGDSFVEEYEQYVAEASPKQSVTPIRYDYSPGLYKEGRHPAAHFHVGNENEIRIGAAHVLGPAAFALFVIRQAYPELWTKLLDQQGRKRFVERQCHTNCDRVPESYLRELDRFELVLG